MQKNIISSRKSSIEQNIENNRQDLELLQEQRIVNLAKNISFGMSHEFKTPLNAIQLLCESCVAQIQQKDFNKKQLNNMLQDIQHHNKIMFCKVNEFLDMKKIVEGSFDYNRSQFDLNEILEELKGIFIEQFRSKGIILNIENNLKNSVVYQDRQRLLQVLINIVGNALKFTFAGQVKLSIKKLENKCLFFEVQDSGIGMNEETVNNLFQLQDGEQKERKQGSGFGLTITKQVLDRIGPKNSIKVQSIQDEKTIVQFQIFKKLFLNQESKTYFVPFENIQRKKRVQTIIVQPSLGKSQSITSKKELKILIVDDTSINISALKLLMKLTVKQRIIIDEAYNGLQAVNMFKANNFDVIFMDINMPIMDGFEAIREIRNIEEQQNRNRSIIAIVTAFGPEEMKKSPCDANTILHKPIQKDQILQFFKEFMKIE